MDPTSDGKLCRGDPKSLSLSEQREMDLQSASSKHLVGKLNGTWPCLEIYPDCLEVYPQARLYFCCFGSVL